MVFCQKALGGAAAGRPRPIETGGLEQLAAIILICLRAAPMYRASHLMPNPNATARMIPEHPLREQNGGTTFDRSRAS
jgi:hypothetical protein